MRRWSWLQFRKLPQREINVEYIHLVFEDILIFQTGDEEFVFYADRLIRLLIEEALETVQYSEKVLHMSCP